MGKTMKYTNLRRFENGGLKQIKWQKKSSRNGI
jgi:hypothetical protein